MYLWELSSVWYEDILFCFCHIRVKNGGSIYKDHFNNFDINDDALEWYHFLESMNLFFIPKNKFCNYIKEIRQSLVVISVLSKKASNTKLLFVTFDGS